MAGGAITGGTLIGVSTVKLITALTTASIIGGPIIIAVATGLATLGLGLWAGYSIFKEGQKLTEEPEIREVLNNIMSKALKEYDLGKFNTFIEVLSTEYKHGAALVELKVPGDVIDSKKIVKELLVHGFRPDGIAYLLVILGEVLISG